MLNPFPELLFFSLLGPFILRVVVGFIFINLGYLKITSEKSLWANFLDTIHFRPTGFCLSLIATIEIIGGFMLLAGFWTQIAALVLGVFTLGELYAENRDEALVKRNLVFYVLVLAILVSLLVSGAGAFAIDLPL